MSRRDSLATLLGGLMIGFSYTALVVIWLSETEFAGGGPGIPRWNAAHGANFGAGIEIPMLMYYLLAGGPFVAIGSVLYGFAYRLFVGRRSDFLYFASVTSVFSYAGVICGPLLYLFYLR